MSARTTKKLPMLAVDVTLTDTFSGEPNYAWVRRERFFVPDGTSNLTIAREVKRVMELTGCKGRAVWYGGDSYEFRPWGANLVLMADVLYANSGE